MEDIILVGFGGHAKSISDAVEQSGKCRIAGYIDNHPSDCTIYRWLGNDDMLDTYFKAGIQNAVISIGYMGVGSLRDRLYTKLKRIGYHLPVIIDKSAVIANDVQIGEGTFVGKNAVINAGSKIGVMCIINSGALVEHENTIGDFSHIAVRSVLCGNVSIGSHTLIGANATIIQGVQIGDHCIIGAGSTVLRGISDKKTVYGISGGGEN